jgi:hypothetical protein
VLRVGTDGRAEEAPAEDELEDVVFEAKGVLLFVVVWHHVFALLVCIVTTAILVGVLCSKFSILVGF